MPQATLTDRPPGPTPLNPAQQRALDLLRTRGVERPAFAPGLAASQQLGAATTTTGCRPLVSTQVAAGVNLALGRGSQADQTILAQGPRGALATTQVSRGANIALGARSTATQRILNLTTP